MTAPLLGPRPDGDQTCGDLTEGRCWEQSTWHILWTPDLGNGVCCEKHYAYARKRWVMYDSHPVTSLCTMPNTTVEWSWEKPPGRCLWQVSDETLTLALAAERETPDA